MRFIRAWVTLAFLAAWQRWKRRAKSNLRCAKHCSQWCKPEKAGRPDRALALHRELTLHIRKAQHENIVRHQELHLKQLESSEDTQFPPHLLEEKDAELTEKIAAQTVGTKQGRLLEQMAFTAEIATIRPGSTAIASPSWRRYWRRRTVSRLRPARRSSWRRGCTISARSAFRTR